MAGNWVKVHREMMDHAIWQDEWHVKLFMWCLLKANYKEGTFAGKVVQRGQFVTGRNTASDELQVSPSKWYRGIHFLASLGCIEINANNNWTTITVCNYSTYQQKNGDDEPQVNNEWTTDEQQMDNERTTNEQQMNNERTLEKEEQEVKKVINNKYKFQKPTVEEIADYCKQRNNGVDPEIFFDHYESVGWKVGRNPMKDWRASVRKWERTANDRPSYSNNGKQQPKYAGITPLPEDDGWDEAHGFK